MKDRCDNGSESSRKRWLLIQLFVLLILFAIPRAWAQCSVSRESVPVHEGPIGVLYSDRVPSEVVAQALQLWNACPDLGGETPRLLDQRLQNVNLLVRYENPSAGLPRVCADIRGRVITLYSQTWDEVGRPFLCGSPAMNLAHEIGHYFGLRHPRRHTGCERNIMSTIDQRNRFSRRLDAETCRAVSSAQRLAERNGVKAGRPVGRPGPKTD